ncbi:hypothetical protein PIB30_040040 [Stylosanthes scabra]|uniref:Uncharacterized protein n=1 Tax=Stylosanthes scabra TaxID=79078 RepID=A0ABU6SF71_9FABA|nr:hypothetical protein [Stylosanthes scabra]
MAYPEKVREWFKNNPRSLKISDPETASFLNQKAQIQAALAGSQSKKSINDNAYKIDLPEGTITRARAKKLKESFGNLVMRMHLGLFLASIPL